MFKRNTTPLTKSEAQQPVQAVERITSVLGSGVIWHGSINGSGGVRIEAFEVRSPWGCRRRRDGRVTCQNVRHAVVWRKRCNSITTQTGIIVGRGAMWLTAS
jgi:hypothetical protein